MYEKTLALEARLDQRRNSAFASVMYACLSRVSRVGDGLYYHMHSDQKLLETMFKAEVYWK